MTDPRYPARAVPDPDIPDPKGLIGVDGEFARSVKKALDIGLNRSGDPGAAFVRVRDLEALGLAGVDYSGSSGGLRGPTGPNRNNPGPNPFLRPPRPGSSPRPAVFTGLRTLALWNGIRIYWDYPQPPPGSTAIEFAGVEIYGAEQTGEAIPTFAQATSVGTAAGAVNFWTHDLGPTGFGKTWWYWLRWLYITNAQFPIAFSQFTPGEDAQGLRGRSDVEPSTLVNALTNQIRQDSLQIGLADRIALGEFSTDATGPVGTISARLLAVNALGNSAIGQVATLRGQVGGLLSGTYSVRADLNGYVTGFGFTARVDPNGDLNPYLPGDQQYESAFVIRANRFAIEVPNEPGAPVSQGPRYPFTVGQIINPDWNPPTDAPDTLPTIANGGLIDAVGINGRLAVNGTIHADALRAGTIRARHIDAVSIATEVLSADRIIGGSIATSGTSNWRVVITGGDNLYPFWYGIGDVGGAGTTISMDRLGNVRLAGFLQVAQGGVFGTEGGVNDARVEIGGGDGLIMWAGRGPRSFNSGNFIINGEGNVFIRGLPLTVPAAANADAPVSFNVVPAAGQPTGKVLIFGHCVVYETGSGTGDDDLKNFVVEILVNGTPVQGVGVDEMRLEQMPVTIAHIGDYAGTIICSLRVTSTRGAPVALKNTNIILLQVQGGT